ncbi:Uncharacterized protein Fot_10826 [Forsythia ovata]|uniref:Uncharacterized protein n=1 Tax=Forsythia ovata TaxID=205694 RepID=A0ABD1WHY3_9LAMI
MISEASKGFETKPRVRVNDIPVRSKAEKKTPDRVAQNKCSMLKMPNYEEEAELEEEERSDEESEEESGDGEEVEAEVLEAMIKRYDSFLSYCTMKLHLVQVSLKSFETHVDYKDTRLCKLAM